MFKTLATVAIIFIVSSNFSDFSETDPLGELKAYAAVASQGQSSDSPLSLGGRRTVDGAFKSGSFTIAGTRF